MIFKIGDIVKVKPYEQIANQATTDSYNDLKVVYKGRSYWFIETMKKYCKNNYRINYIKGEKVYLECINESDEQQRTLQQCYFLHTWLTNTKQIKNKE